MANRIFSLGYFHLSECCPITLIHPWDHLLSRLLPWTEWNIELMDTNTQLMGSHAKITIVWYAPIHHYSDHHIIIIIFITINGFCLLSHFSYFRKFCFLNNFFLFILCSSLSFCFVFFFGLIPWWHFFQWANFTVWE